MLATLLVAGAADAKSVVLVAGDASHAYGQHEFRAGCELLARALAASGLDLDVVVLPDGWPAELEEVDALVLYMNGGASHPALAHMDEIDRLMARGVGLMAMHYAVEVPQGAASDAFQRWIGGYYEDGWSTNPHWRANAVLALDHPIRRGVTPFALHDEWYFNIRFREGLADVTPILTAVPDDEARSGATSWPRGPHEQITAASGREEILMWAVERRDGGRGLGFTGGHFHWSWGNDAFRTLVLNAIVWVAGLEVPEAGVPSRSPTFDQLEADLDVTPWKTIDRWLRFDRGATLEKFGVR